MCSVGLKWYSLMHVWTDTCSLKINSSSVWRSVCLSPYIWLFLLFVITEVVFLELWIPVNLHILSWLGLILEITLLIIKERRNSPKEYSWFNHKLKGLFCFNSSFHYTEQMIHIYLNPFSSVCCSVYSCLSSFYLLEKHRLSSVRSWLFIEPV